MKVLLGDATQHHKRVSPKMGRGGQEGTGHHPNTGPPLARLPHVGNNFSKREQKTEEDTLQ